MTRRTAWTRDGRRRRSRTRERPIGSRLALPAPPPSLAFPVCEPGTFFFLFIESEERSRRRVDGDVVVDRPPSHGADRHPTLLPRSTALTRTNLFSEYKKRLKAAATAKAKAEKEAKRAAAAAAAPKVEKKKSDEEEEGELDATQYTANRINKVLARKERGETPYPHKFHVDTQLPEFIQKFNDIPEGETREGETVAVAGRLMSKRASRR